MKRAARAFAAGLVALVVAGCASDPRWRATRRPDAVDAASLLASDRADPARGERPEEVPRVPVRRRLRPCCGFGSGLHVQVGAIRVPGFSIDNIRSPDALGRHVYDAGQNAQDTLVGTERNGLVYSCRGGFIDIAHVRDYADWTLYLATEFGRQLETGARIEIPDSEGGRRTIVLEAIDPAFVATVGRRELSSALAAWMAFRMSIWHEIATWYGWSSFSIFPERASAFSPEDLYSNLLGTKLATAIVNAGNDLSEPLFNESMDAWLGQSLRFLGGVPDVLGEEMMQAVDGRWWNSKARLPDPALVLRRSFDLGLHQSPWIVPLEWIAPTTRQALEEHCEEPIEPHPLRNPRRLYDLSFADVVRLEIALDDRLGRHPAFARFDGTITDADFEPVVARIREEGRQEFGAQIDRPRGTP